VLLYGGHGVVVKVIDDERCPLGGELDVELKEERGDRRGSGCRGGEGEEDVAIGVEEFE
jgi:hypothetical protein